MILEVYLDHFVRKSEHNGVPCPHPFLDIYHVLNLPFRQLLLFNLLGLISLWLLTSL
jgi:hypothetical protein